MLLGPLKKPRAHPPLHTFPIATMPESKRVIGGIGEIQVTVPVSLGSSEGLVFNKYGYLVGFLQASDKDENSKNIISVVPLYPSGFWVHRP
jgi:hypothetical protein